MNYDNYISFYEVDLVCNLISSIGCGSRSKPILIELENKRDIKEVKLNRKGNIIGIVWHKNTNTDTHLGIVTSVFSEYELFAKKINPDLYHENLTSFLNEENPWLDSANIDELSREEAEEVANQLISIYEKEEPLSANQRSILKKDTVNIFYDFFLNFEAMEQLSDTKMYKKLVVKVIGLSKNYIDPNKIPVVNSLLNAIKGHSEKKYQSDCCSN